MASKHEDNNQFTREDHIKQLRTIDQNVVKLLQSAGQAVHALTSQPSEDHKESGDINRRKATFTSATSQYFSLLSSIDVNMRRQIYGLEEAGIVSADFTPKEASFLQSKSDTQQSRDKAATEVGGTGALDVGWLNSRNDKVGKEMEAELWTKARILMDELNADGLD